MQAKREAITGQHCALRRYSLEALRSARHEYELTPAGAVHVFLDHRHMGVGGDDSWSPSVLPVPPPPSLHCGSPCTRLT